MSKIVQWLLFFFFTLLPLLFAVNTSELFELPKFIFLFAISLLILICYLFDGVVYQDWSIPRLRHPITLSILAILLTQGLSTLTSIHPYTSFWGYYSRFHQGLLTTICYTILYLSILKYMDLKFVQKIIKSTVLVSVFISLLAIFEHFNISVTCPFINSSFTDSCWKETTNPLYRSFATLGQPNWLAAYLIPNLFLLIYLYRDRKKLSPHQSISLYLFGIGIIFLAILYTKSRSGYLAMALSTLTYLLLSWRHSGKNIFTKSVYALAIPLIIGSLIYLVPTWSKRFGASLIVPKEESGDTALATISTSSADIRKIVWSGALQLFKQRPLLGFGPETFAYTYYQVRPKEHNYTTEWDFLYNKAHNEYLNMAATTGIIGLLAYLLLHFAVIKSALIITPRSKKINQVKETYLSEIKPLVGASIISFTVTNFFGFSIIPVYALMMLYSALLLLNLESSTNNFKRSTLVYFLLISIVLIILFPLRFYLADTYYQLGKAASSLGKTDWAITTLTTAHNLRPQEDLYLSYLAEAYASKGDQEHALPLLQESKQRNNLHQNYLKSRAKAFINLAAYDSTFYTQAVSELEHASTLAPTDPKLFYNLGLVYSRQGLAPKAVASIQKSLELKKDYYEPYYALTLLYESTKSDKLVPDLLKEAQKNLKTIPQPLQLKIDKYLGV